MSNTYSTTNMTDEEIKQSHHSIVETLVKPGDKILKQTTPRIAHILHMTLGISGEASEIFEMFKQPRNNDFKTKLALELGDIAFYTQGLMLVFDWTPAHVCSDEFDAEQVLRIKALADMYGIPKKDLAPTELVNAAGQITERIKKYWIYNKPLATEDIQIQLGKIVSMVRIIANGYGYSYADILRMNMEKLGKRYDNFKYSDKAAIERKDAQ